MTHHRYGFSLVGGGGEAAEIFGDPPPPLPANLNQLLCGKNKYKCTFKCLPMAKNTGKSYRRGAVDNRSQTYNPVTEQWVKRDAQTGQFIDVFIKSQ